MSRHKISLNNLSGHDSRDLSGRYPADRIRVSAWYCQILSEVPACYLGITRGWVRPFYLPVIPVYGFTKFYTNLFRLIYLLPNFKLPVLVPIWGLEQKKSKFGFPHCLPSQASPPALRQAPRLETAPAPARNKTRTKRTASLNLQNTHSSPMSEVPRCRPPLPLTASSWTTGVSGGRGACSPPPPPFEPSWTTGV
jgi:hypothetical protein